VVNTQLIELYWTIGKTILDRQSTVGWGAKVIDQLAADLSLAFPDSMVPTAAGPVQVDVLEVSDADLSPVPDDPTDRLHVLSHDWAAATATEGPRTPPTCSTSFG
jgi:hypothetical protein